jgi:hypothetical protein
LTTKQVHCQRDIADGAVWESWFLEKYRRSIVLDKQVSDCPSLKLDVNGAGYTKEFISLLKMLEPPL